jgi:hypothetical protein
VMVPSKSVKKMYFGLVLNAGSSLWMEPFDRVPLGRDIAVT